MASGKDKLFDRAIEELRQQIQTSAKPFPDGKAAQRERIRQAERDMEFFGRTYFPHYVTSPSSALHKYICERFPAMIEKAIATGIGDKESDAAPRGNAKSTWTTLILVLWVAAYKKRKFPLIVSETNAQACDFISFIKLELENNERLAQDFPELCGEGPIWQADTIITRNGVKIRGVGAGQKLRGMRHGSRRPDLVIVDDLENDEAVESAEQRKKLEKWFFKALMKIGQKYTVFIVIGTILHYESLLNSLLIKPGWKGRKFKSIIKYSSSHLWNDWELIFTNITIGKEQAEAAADAFFEAHKTEMLAGTEVLWPEVEDYYYLMKMRISEGPAYFESEKQNEPINPEDAAFLEEWITYYDEDEVDLAGIAYGAAVDPSLGKKSKNSDPSAIIGGKKKGEIIYLTFADIEKRHPDKIMTDLLAYHEKQHLDQVAIEAVQFQEFFAGHVEKEAHKRNLTLNVLAVPENTDKDLRIIRLQPWIKNGWIRFRRSGMQELIRQFIYYRPKGKGGHDDGPDAVEKLMNLLVTGVGKIEYQTVASRTSGFGKQKGAW